MLPSQGVKNNCISGFSKWLTQPSQSLKRDRGGRAASGGKVTLVVRHLSVQMSGDIPVAAGRCQRDTRRRGYMQTRG